jgi:hypothetical protein
LLPTLSRLSVSCAPEDRLRRRCSCESLRISPLHSQFRLPLTHSRYAVSSAIPRLSPGISHPTYISAYAPFTPSHSEQRLLPSYYRGCWHEVSRSLFVGYRHYRPPQKGFTIRRPSSPTRRRWIRVSPIVQYSPLLPPVGVWAVSQSQCGCSSSQTSYRSKAW